ncbi:MAG: ankyrin repeat domain-containing protein [Saprospiraceae bacterium]|nr:ankyrin repeat domain-containing protein [Saprospiraceae bacterium]
MSTKMLSILTYLLIAGMLIFLVFTSFGTTSGGDAATRGLGKFLIVLPVAAIIFLVVYHLPINNWIKYLGLTIGLLCFAALIIFLLALSGSSLLFQDTRQPFTPQYDDPVLTQLFDAFHRGKVRKWKSLLQSHPEHLQHKQLLNDILNDACEGSRSNAHKLEALKYMLDAGATIDSIHCHAFSNLAYTCKADFTELLLQHGADPNCMPIPSQTVLFYCMGGVYGEVKIFELLIKYGVDVNAITYNEQHQDNLTPLLYAVYLGQWPCCITLLDNGADLNYKNKDGISIKDYILQKAENPEDIGYYKNPDFLQLVEHIKQYQ